VTKPDDSTTSPAERQRGGGRLVDDPENFEAGDPAGVLGGLALRVGEVGGTGDDRLIDLLSEIRLGVNLQLLQHERRDLLRREHAVVDLLRPVGAHLPLDRHHRPLGVGHSLSLGDHTDQPLAILGEGDDARRRSRSFGVRDDDRFAAFDGRCTAVRRSKIYADHRVLLRHSFHLIN